MNPLAIVRFTALYIAAVFSILLTGCILIAHDISAPFRQVLVSTYRASLDYREHSFRPDLPGVP